MWVLEQRADMEVAGPEECNAFLHSAAAEEQPCLSASPIQDEAQTGRTSSLLPSSCRHWAPRVRPALLTGLVFASAAFACTVFALQGFQRHRGDTLDQVHDTSSFQEKLGLNDLVKGFFSKDPFQFQCPVPPSIADATGAGFSDLMRVKHHDDAAGHGVVSITFGAQRRLGSRSAVSSRSLQDVEEKEGGQEDTALEKQAECCNFYRNSWWPYQYPECRNESICPSCWKETPLSEIKEHKFPAHVAGAAWAATGAVYESKQANQFGWNSGEILIQLDTGLHPHYANVCPHIGDWHQYTFDFLWASLRVRAYKSHKARLAIVSFRGTEPAALMNWLVDFEVLTENLRLGDSGLFSKVHRGYLDALRPLMPKVKQWVEGYIFGWGKVPHDWKLVFTGHSMGGAFATLAATLVYIEDWKRKPDAVITFGAPRVSDVILSNWWEEQGYCDSLLRVNVYNDIIHQMPFSKQAIHASMIKDCIEDIEDCLTVHPSAANKTFDKYWRHICPNSEVLVPGAVKGVNREKEDFSMIGGPFAHQIDQCKYGYAYGVLHSGIADLDKYCGLTPDVCPEFSCSVVEDLKGIGCSGLSQNIWPKSASECRQSCCSDREGSCEVWQWLKNGQCWTGRSNDCKRWSWWSHDVLQSERIK